LQEKSESEYFVKDKKSGRLHAHCKACYGEHRKTYAVEHYFKYGDQYRERAKVRRAMVRRGLQDQLVAYMKDKMCIDCDESDIRVLEFDHLDPTTKKFGISKAMTDGKKWEEILIEISKCQILCANCHKKRTAAQFGWFKAIGIE
jgi:hypothetical protein